MLPKPAASISNSSTNASLQVEGDNLCMYDTAKPIERVSQSMNEWIPSNEFSMHSFFFSGSSKSCPGIRFESYLFTITAAMMKQMCQWIQLFHLITGGFTMILCVNVSKLMHQKNITRCHWAFFLPPGWGGAILHLIRSDWLRNYWRFWLVEIRTRPHFIG